MHVCVRVRSGVRGYTFVFRLDVDAREDVNDRFALLSWLLCGEPKSDIVHNEPCGIIGFCLLQD